MPKKFALIDTSIIYCGECLDQLRKLPDASIDLPFRVAEILDEQIVQKLA